jgi:hypothetical protein
MKIACHPVGLDFIESAPLRFVNKVEINASPEDVFNVLADADSWPRFVRDIRKARWTSQGPHGVGSTRTVFLTGMTVQEKFIAWEPGRRFTFCITESTVPLARAVCEDYRLEPSGSEKTLFTYVLACEPALLLKLLGPAGRWFLGGLCSRIAQGLAAFMKEKQKTRGLDKQ